MMLCSYPLIWEKQVTVQRSFSPVLREYYDLKREKTDSATLAEFVYSDKMDQYFRQSFILLDQTEFASPFLNGNCIQLALTLQSFVKDYPGLGKKYSIESDFINNYAEKIWLYVESSG